MDVTRYLFSLIVVGGFLLFAVWVLRKYRSVIVGKSGSPVRLVSVVALGPKERLVVVEYGSQQFLLGVTAHSITKVSVMELKEDLSGAST